MQIVIALFDRFTALDAVGPHQVLHHLPDAEVIFAASGFVASPTSPAPSPCSRRRPTPMSRVRTSSSYPAGPARPPR